VLDYLSKNALAIISLIISSYILLTNKKILSKSYRLSRDGARSEEVELIFVESRQQEESVVLKLVLFNPGNVAAIIHSLTVYESVSYPMKLLRYLGLHKWREIEDARWWPSHNETFEGQKTVKDEYASLYVKDYRDIFVIFPGYRSRNEYKFFVQTNHGSTERITTIDAIEIYFPHRYRKWYRDS
jgi:hypothetical protein